MLLMTGEGAFLCRLESGERMLIIGEGLMVDGIKFKPSASGQRPLKGTLIKRDSCGEVRFISKVRKYIV